MRDKDAAVLGCLLVLFVLTFNLVILALVGAGVAYCWNEFLIPNVTANLPIIVWWQGSIGAIGLRLIFGMFRG